MKNINRLEEDTIEVLFIITEERIDEYLGVGYLSAALSSKGVISKTLQWSIPSTKELVEDLIRQEKNICLVGIPWLYIFSEPQVAKIAKKIKALRPDVKIVIGGHPATFEYTRILKAYPEIDFVMRGEGDKSILELFSAVRTNNVPHKVSGVAFRDSSGSIIATPSQPQIKDIDQLPYPDRSTLDQVIEYYGNSQRLLVRMIGSRGCYARCEFCSMVSFYSLDGVEMTWNPRKVESIFRELYFLVEKYGVNTFWFADDEFIGPPPIGVPRVLYLARLLRESGLNVEYGFDARACGITAFSYNQLEYLRGSGLRVIAMGLESNSQAALKRINKGIRVQTNWDAIRKLSAVGIDYRYGFIMYDEHTSLDDIRENLEFLRFVGPHKICNTGSYRLLNAEFPEVGTPLFYKLGKDTHDVDVYRTRNFPQLPEEQLGYSFSDHTVSRYRRLLMAFASEVVEPVTIQRPKTESQLQADVWYGVNHTPHNVAVMKAFLDCHEWLLEQIKNLSMEDDQVITDMEHFFQLRLANYKSRYNV